MTILDRITTIHGDLNVTYHDADSFANLPIHQCRQCYGICYQQEQIVLSYSRKRHYVLPGGTIEPGESLEQTLAREIQEEANLRLIYAQPIGYQVVEQANENPIFQLRYYVEAERFGPFVSDPAGQIIRIKTFNPSAAAAALRWGQIGERLFQRAAEIHAQRKN